VQLVALLVAWFTAQVVVVPSTHAPLQLPVPPHPSYCVFHWQLLTFTFRVLQ
jgi:hypothetical protein